MLTASLLAITLFQAPQPIERDAFGVPHILARSQEEAFFHAGFAVAEDRLWQMEMSRRIARGRMAEVFGSRSLASDKEILATAYTDAELKLQFEKLSPELRLNFEKYADGVNAYIQFAKQNQKLPAGYAQNSFQPEAWTVLDSAAIAIRLFHQFGRFGAGEIRNYALSLYMQTQPVKNQVLDVMDDFLWQNDPSSPTTIREKRTGATPKLSDFTRADSERQLSGLPKISLFELIPGFRLEMQEDSRMLAENHAVPYRMGSYAIAVDQGRSASGNALLLSAPQMGFTDPSIVHEMSISAPGIRVAGMDVPGVPGVVIGYTPDLSWALTSGVADTDDLFILKKKDQQVQIDEKWVDLTLDTRDILVKGASVDKVTRMKSDWGPVVLESKGTQTVFVRRSAAYLSELQSMEAVYRMYTATTPDQVREALAKATVNFNCLYATKAGEIGFQYVGRVPVRAKGVDPRFPSWASKTNDWQGFLPFEKMPFVINPEDGLLYNWNNKPESWWPNLDTPAWGRIFRVSALTPTLSGAKIGVSDVEKTAWNIARKHELAESYQPRLLKWMSGFSGSELEMDALRQFSGWGGDSLQDSVGSTILTAWVNAIRQELFPASVGTMMTPDLFSQAIQPSLILNALERKTKVNYLGKRTASELVQTAFRGAVAGLVKARGESIVQWGLRPSSISFSGESPIPYRDRGTYIQIIEMARSPFGRNVLPPGVAESGAHSRDQIPLSRAWTYKPMKIRS